MEEQHKNHSYFTYDEVISKAQAVQPYFAADLPQFTAFDPWFTPAVNTKLVSGIYLGHRDFSESSLLAEINRIKELLDTIFAASVQSYKELNYYADLGFKEATTTYETFGYPNFEDARHSVKKMIGLLNQAHAAMLNEGNQARLLDVGMPVGLPLDIANIAAEMAAMDEEQKILKKQHLLVTRERIDLFNSMWDVLSKICESAKIIFANNPDRLDVYDLYDTGGWNVDMMEFMHLN